MPRRSPFRDMARATPVPEIGSKVLRMVEEGDGVIAVVREGTPVVDARVEEERRRGGRPEQKG